MHNLGVVNSCGPLQKEIMEPQVFQIIALSCYHCISIREKFALISLFVVIDLGSQSQSVVNVHPL